MVSVRGAQSWNSKPAHARSNENYTTSPLNGSVWERQIEKWMADCLSICRSLYGAAMILTNLSRRHRACGLRSLSEASADPRDLVCSMKQVLRMSISLLNLITAKICILGCRSRKAKPLQSKQFGFECQFKRCWNDSWKRLRTVYGVPAAWAPHCVYACVCVCVQWVLGRVATVGGDFLCIWLKAGGSEWKGMIV